MSQFFDLFADYQLGDLLAQNPNYALGATGNLGTATINSAGELVFKNGTGWGFGENLYYTGLPASNQIEVYAQIHNGQGRIGVSASTETDMNAATFGSYTTSRVNNDNTELSRISSGSRQTLVNNFSTEPGNGVFAKILFRVTRDGSNNTLFQYKYWVATNPEPATWDVEYTDTSSVRVTDPLIGALHLRSGVNSTFRVIEFGIGTDGDPAPRQKVTPSGQEIVTSLKSLTITGHKAAIRAAVNVQAGKAALNLATHRTTVSVNRTINTSLTSLNLTTHRTLSGGIQETQTNLVNLTINTHKSNVSQATRVVTSKPSLSISSYKADVKVSDNTLAVTDHLKLTGRTSLVSVDKKIETSPLTLTITTHRANVSSVENVKVNPVSLNITGQPATVSANFKVNVITTVANIKLITYKVENFYTGIMPVNLLDGVNIEGSMLPGTEIEPRSLTDGVNIVSN